MTQKYSNTFHHTFSSLVIPVLHTLTLYSMLLCVLSMSLASCVPPQKCYVRYGPPLLSNASVAMTKMYNVVKYLIIIVTFYPFTRLFFQRGRKKEIDKLFFISNENFCCKSIIVGEIILEISYTPF